MNEFVSHLREEHRVKLMTDYAYILKYGKLALVAPKVWLDVLREHEALLPAGLVVQWVEFSNIEDTEMEVETHKIAYVTGASRALLDDAVASVNCWAEGDGVVCMTTENAMEHEALRPLLKDIDCDGHVIISL